MPVGSWAWFECAAFRSKSVCDSADECKQGGMATTVPQQERWSDDLPQRKRIDDRTTVNANEGGNSHNRIIVCAATTAIIANTVH